MIDRTHVPELKEINGISIVAPEIETDFPVPFYVMQKVPNNTSRIELFFNAGTINGKTGLASLVSGLLLSGTDNMTSTEIHTAMDDLGGYHDVSIGHESVVVTLYGLNDKLVEILQLFIKSFQEVNFKDKEITELISDRKQKHKINLEKVNFLAQRTFTQHLFYRSDYGKIISLEDYDSITREEIVLFHKKYYLEGLFKIVVVGELKDSKVHEIKQVLIPFCNKNRFLFAENLNNNTGRFDVKKEGALQTAIRIGRTLFNRKNSDFIDFTVLNTILGDYFGSRLMSNLREDKGFTYGVGSMISEFQNTGYFLIGTEVGSEHTENALAEIKTEITRLQTDLVEKEELELVKNYLLGQLLKSADGPYAMTDLFVHLQTFGMSPEYYNTYIERIKQITPVDLMACAKKYLNWNGLTIVTAG